MADAIVTWQQHLDGADKGMIKRMLTALALAAFGATAAPAQQVLEVPITGEILSGWQRPDGTRMAAIKLTLAPGWKTYWRAPGDTGIPPQISWKRSRNLSSVGLIWPAPKVYRDGGVLTIGYKEELVLPIVLAPKRAGQPIKLRAALDIGVCSDVCIPHRMTLEGMIDDDRTKPTPAVAAALAARPLSAQEAGVRAASCAVRPNADGLEITTALSMPTLGGKEVVVIEPGVPGVWMSETDVERQGTQLRAIGDMAALDGAVLSLDRSQVTITVVGTSGAVEIKGCAPA